MSKAMRDMQPQALRDLIDSVRRDLDIQSGNQLSLDLTRGKPASEQLSLSHGLEAQINGDYNSQDGTDVRNYGGLRGISEVRELGEEIMGVPASHIIAGGNSSLSLMHLVVTSALVHGLPADRDPWSACGAPKILAPAPGYDRHFTLTESLGIEMLPVKMLPTGPDMAQAQALVAADPTIKGIWCVPKYSNPTGCVYDDATVQALAELPKVAAADNFHVLWDNAYAVHDLVDDPPQLASLFEAASKAGTLAHTVQFASTSKITFAGAGISFIASDESTLATLERQLGLMSIGPDKVNQLRHARFLKGRITKHMRAHAEILRPKFALIQKLFAQRLAPYGIAEWNDPQGGYFVSLDLMPGLARRVVALAGSVGLKLTAAGATFPYGDDPEDRNVRIAPTFADLPGLEAALDVLIQCIVLASAEALLEQST